MLYDRCIRQMILLITKLMENTNQTIDKQVNYLIIYSNYLSNNTMDIGSINLPRKCQITSSNSNATSLEILIESNNNLQTRRITSSSRCLRSPPCSYRYLPNEQPSTLTLQF
ncbi:unnamed protein product [Rotaria sp. Silwood2]|nr:unnamed protein product [Rotaria sp. Silwood2]CAF3331680.1 unnamed protein product [Rotaria sp. Silwood2]CAF4463312.1 unnamed protein product [Rotaria sp. Silwood2]CAF4510692.1 unnamed protein product [Rotaria sp. Silwood2]